VTRAEDTDAYLREHVRQALATDERVNEPELDVEVEGDRILVTGVVPTDERRAAVTEVVRSCCPELDVDNRTTVAERRPTSKRERLT
jgi:hypothetical protein